jgi:hypothetical protein
MAAKLVDFPEPVAPTNRTQAALGQRNIFRNGRKPQFVDGDDVHFDLPDDEADVAALTENIHAESAQVREEQGQVHFHLFSELGPLFLLHHVVGQGLQVFVRERLVADRLGHALNPVHGRQLDRQVDVRRVLLHHDLENVVNRERHWGLL